MERTLVIVDDSHLIGDMLRSFFEDMLGFRMLAYGTNGMQAVSLYKQHRPALITLDLTMPIKDGKTALVEILAEDPAARVLMVSSQMGSPIIECLKLGAVGYVEKPLRFDSREFVEEFTSTVNRAFDP